MIHRRAFRAMGTDVELLLDADVPAPRAAEAFAAAEREIARLQSRLSRFEPGSELSRLNDAGRLDAGPELFAVVTAALEARACTRGRFDPTVLDAVVAAGYDRSFELVEPEAADARYSAAPCGGGVTLDHRRSRITLEPGVRLDLGGIAKGWAADRVLGQLASHGPALVNLGGDIAAAGREWPVGVETPRGALTVAIDAGGIATTGRDRRHWRRGGEERHHLIDPATGAPARGDLLTVTAVAPTAVEAEVRATALFLAGSAEKAAAEAEATATPCILVSDDGSTVFAGGLR